MDKTTLRNVLKTGITLAVYVSVFSTLMIVANELTKDEIAQNKARERMTLIKETLPSTLIAQPAVSLTPMSLAAHPLLGTTQTTTGYSVRQGDQTVAVVIEAIARGGYSGNIRLLVAVSPQLTVLGVRVLEHRETPGIGDYIAEKPSEKNPTVWLSQFENRSLSHPPKSRWAVRKDGGVFDAVAGATVSPRAVTAAVKNVLLYSADNQARLF